MFEGPPSFEKKPDMPPLDEINQGSKKGPSSLEKEQEHIPTLEEVRSLFMKLINKEHGENCNPVEQRVTYLEVRREEDEGGNLYFLNAKTLGDSKGEIHEYSYQREGHHGMNRGTETAIDEIYYDKKIKCWVGAKVAIYVEGKWEIQVDENGKDL